MPNTSLNNNNLQGQFYAPNTSGFPAVPLLTLLKMCPGAQMCPGDTKLKKVPVKTSFKM